MTVKPMGCAIASIGPNGGLNHIEVRVSQNQIDVYAMDAGKTTPLIQIAKINDVNLSFTQGLIWLEDVRYNADTFLRLRYSTITPSLGTMSLLMAQGWLATSVETFWTP